MSCKQVILSLALLLTVICDASYDPNMDRTFFDIKWPGSNIPVDLGELNDENSMVVMTKDNEKYRCLLPTTIVSTTQEEIDGYDGPIEFDLLEPLMDQTSCSYRIEAYWTYELCHGRHLRQYHEEKEMGKKSKLQEYYLGHFDRVAGKATIALKQQQKEERAEQDEGAKPLRIIVVSKSYVKRVQKFTPMKRVEGVDVPYYEMHYKDGTVCDLTKTPRNVHIHYTCHLEGRGEIYEIKETSSCEYEVVILSNLLCTHPSYAPPKEPTNTIRCHAMESAAKKPKTLMQFEAESSSGKYNRQLWEDINEGLWEELLDEVLTQYGGKVDYVSAQKAMEEDEEDDDDDDEDDEDDEYVDDDEMKEMKMKDEVYDDDFDDDEVYDDDDDEEYDDDDEEDEGDEDDDDDDDDYWEEEVVYERVHKKQTSTFYQKPPAAQQPAQQQQTAQQTSATKPAGVNKSPQPPQPVKEDAIGPETDRQLVRDFLSGTFCIKGGTGWWKHEFCYGKRVIQYHEDKSGTAVIVLGTWNQEAHNNWLELNPNKQPKMKLRKSVSQYYGAGDVCDLTGKPRFTEVKLKCKENPAQPHAVAIYLVEPNACEYIVVVESPLLCPLIEKADNHGLIPTTGL